MRNVITLKNMTVENSQRAEIEGCLSQIMGEFEKEVLETRLVLKPTEQGDFSVEGSLKVKTRRGTFVAKVLASDPVQSARKLRRKIKNQVYRSFKRRRKVMRSGQTLSVAIQNADSVF